jgi:hypothetical protein
MLSALIRNSGFMQYFMRMELAWGTSPGKGLRKFLAGMGVEGDKALRMCGNKDKRARVG